MAAAQIHSRSAVIKGREVKTFSVYRSLVGSSERIEVRHGRLGYPDGHILYKTVPATSLKGALAAKAEAIAELTGQGWEYCERWQEHEHEKMTVASLGLVSGLKGKRANQPAFMTIEYPEPYHLAAYIKVVTHATEQLADGMAATEKKEFEFDYPSALEAKRGAQSRIDAAMLIGYQIVQTGGPLDTGNAAALKNAKAAVKLLLDTPPAAEDWGPLVVAIEPRTLTGEVAIRFAIRPFSHSDSRLRDTLRKKQPIPMAYFGKGPGVFYPSAVNEESANSQVVTVLAVGALVGGKLVGGATMPAMGINSSFAEIHSKPEEPKAIRHIELE